MTTETTPRPQDTPPNPARGEEEEFLPPAVRAQRDAAEKAWKEAYTPEGEQPGGEAPKAPPGADENTIVTRVDNLAELKPKLAEPPKEEPPKAEPPADPLAEMRSRYDRDMAQARDTIAGLRGSIQQLQQQITQLAQTRQPEPPKQEEPAAPRLVSPEEEQTYGKDLLDVIARRAQEVYEPIVGKLMRQVETLKGELAGMNGHVANAAHNSLAQVMEKSVGPDWFAQNNDTDFLNWLAQEDPASGFPRLQLLRTAQNAGNAQRVAYFFNAFRRETGKFASQASGTPGTVTQPSNDPPPAPNGTGGNGSPKVPLTSLVAPGKPRSGTQAPQSGTEEIPLLTEREIEDHYKRRKLGKVPKQEREQFDARLAAALAANRVEVLPKF